MNKTSNQKNLRSNLTQDINSTVIFNTTSCSFSSISYRSNSSKYITSYGINDGFTTCQLISPNNARVTIQNVSIEPATTSNTFTLVFSGVGGGIVGGGGGGGIAIIDIKQALLCDKGNVNWSISTDTGQASYSLLTGKNTIREKPFILRNFGTKEITINLKCDDSNENLTQGFCNLINLSRTKITIPPNIEVIETSKMKISIPNTEDYQYGDTYFYSIIASDSNKVCEGVLSNRISINPVGVIGKLNDLRTFGNIRIYIGFVIILIAMITSVISYFGLKIFSKNDNIVILGSIFITLIVVSGALFII